MINLRALLIGISHYEKNDVCTPLEGAVADVEAMEAYLLAQGVRPERICKLTVSKRAEGPPPEPRAKWPTYENMVAAIRRLASSAQPGEHVLIHYSGHGGRVAPSLIPDVKTLDEGLVPPDIGEEGARYLRGVELTHLLHQMAGKGLRVTLIIDACHSAGVFRGTARLVARGSQEVDRRSSAAPESLVASPEQLKRTWLRVHNRAYAPTRGRAPSGWLGAAEGSVLLAACRPIETAYEYPFGGRFRGLLTYHLLEVLAEDEGESSFEQVHRRLIGRVHQHAPHQTPVIEGDLRRPVLGGGLRRLLDAIEVLEVEPPDGRVRLGAGRAVGIAESARLRIMPATASEDREDTSRLPSVKITEVAAFESWGDVAAAGRAAIQPGDRAILIDPGDTFRRRVALVPAERGEGAAKAATSLRDGWRTRWRASRRVLRDGSPRRDTSPGDTEMLGAVRRELERRSGGFLQLIDETDLRSGSSPDFQVAVTRRERSRPRYEIWHPDGAKVTDLPLLPGTDPRAAGRVVDSLEQLAKFHNLRDLENRDVSSPLNGALTVELGLLPSGFARGRDIEPLPFDSADPIPRVETGRWLCLTVANHSPQAFEITVLDLRPGWTVEQIHPSSGGETLEGGTAVRLPFEIYLPGGIESRREVFKVFATVEPTDFRWLRLGTLGASRRRIRSSRTLPQDPLARLLAEVARDGPRTRSTETHFASRYWTSAWIEFEVVAADRP